MLSASSPVRFRRVVVTISERFGKAIAYPFGLGPLIVPQLVNRRHDASTNARRCILAVHRSALTRLGSGGNRGLLRFLSRLATAFLKLSLTLVILFFQKLVAHFRISPYRLLIGVFQVCRRARL